jgi:hypothetical protein
MKISISPANQACASSFRRSAYRETDEKQTDLENVIKNMLHGEYDNPKRVIAFNSAEK